MKKQPLILSVILFLFMATKTLAVDDLTIWVITDLHYLSPTLHDNNGAAIQHIRNTGAGKDIDYGDKRMDALIYHIRQERPNILLISGDLTLNGEYQSMVDLAEYFTQIEQLNTDVYVIPGNHDISSGWARSFEGDTFVRTRQVLPNDFKELFADFGYHEAFSFDQHSLSYATTINDYLWLLMLDSNIYSDKEGIGPPTTKGTLKDDTLIWVETILARAKQQNITVLPVIHHNTITHYEPLKQNYTLTNAVQFQQLMIKYQVPLTLSGHIHTQHYMQYTQDNHTFYDIVTGAFSSFPSYIGKLFFYEQEIKYQAKPLALEKWAQKEQINDENLLHYSQYMAHLFNTASRQMVFQEMVNDGWYQQNLPILAEIADYIAQANLAYFSGLPFDPTNHFTNEQIIAFKQLIEQNTTTFFREYLQHIEDNVIDYTQLDNILN